MLSKNNIQFIRSLAVKKYRQKYHKYLAEGDKICQEILSYAFEEVEMIYCIKDFRSNNSKRMDELDIPFTIVSEADLKKISYLKTPQQCLVVMNMAINSSVKSNKSDIIVYLDDIRDPGNLGTIIRSCEWFGVDLLLLSPNTVDPYNPKVVQATMGSLFRIKQLQKSLDEFIQESNKEYLIYTAEMDGVNCFEVTYEYPCVLVMGNESRGVNLDLENYKSKTISIPSSGNPTESLNVSVATSILLGDMYRKRN